MVSSAHQLSLFSGSGRKVDIELTGPDVESVVTLLYKHPTATLEPIPPPACDPRLPYEEHETSRRWRRHSRH